MPFEYSTIVVPSGERFDYWREVVCRHCTVAWSKPLLDGSFDSTMRVNPVGGMDICSLQSPLHYWERTPQQLRSDPHGVIWLAYFQEGYGEIRQADRQTIVSSGQIVLYDSEQEFQISIGGDLVHLIKLPRDFIVSRLPGAEQMTATVLDENRPGLIPLRMLIEQAIENPPIGQDVAVASRHSDIIVDLLLFCLEMQEFSTPLSCKLYSRALKFMREHLSDPALSGESIAAALNVSFRTLSRAFAKRNSTVMLQVKKERLQASRKALAQGRVRTVSQAAFDCGFSDFSYFSRTFREEFGVPPKSYLKR